MTVLISFILVIIGGLNWLLISLFKYDLVAGMFGSQAAIASRIVYGLVGLAALILIAAAIKMKGALNVSGRTYNDEKLFSMDKD